MKKYICTKVFEAEYQEDKNNPESNGYLVKYTDNDTIFLIKEVFERNFLRVPEGLDQVDPKKVKITFTDNNK